MRKKRLTDKTSVVDDLEEKPTTGAQSASQAREELKRLVSTQCERLSTDEKSLWGEYVDYVNKYLNDLPMDQEALDALSRLLTARVRSHVEQLIEKYLIIVGRYYARPDADSQIKEKFGDFCEKWHPTERFTIRVDEGQELLCLSALRDLVQRVERAPAPTAIHNIQREVALYVDDFRLRHPDQFWGVFAAEFNQLVAISAVLDEQMSTLWLERMRQRREVLYTQIVQPLGFRLLQIRSMDECERRIKSMYQDPNGAASWDNINWRAIGPFLDWAIECVSPSEPCTDQAAAGVAVDLLKEAQTCAEMFGLPTAAEFLGGYARRVSEMQTASDFTPQMRAEFNRIVEQRRGELYVELLQPTFADLILVNALYPNPRITAWLDKLGRHPNFNWERMAEIRVEGVMLLAEHQGSSLRLDDAERNKIDQLKLNQAIAQKIEQGAFHLLELGFTEELSAGTVSQERLVQIANCVFGENNWPAGIYGLNRDETLIMPVDPDHPEFTGSRARVSDEEFAALLSRVFDDQKNYVARIKPNSWQKITDWIGQASDKGYMGLVRFRKIQHVLDATDAKPSLRPPPIATDRMPQSSASQPDSADEAIGVIKTMKESIYFQQLVGAEQWATVLEKLEGYLARLTQSEFYQLRKQDGFIDRLTRQYAALALQYLVPYLEKTQAVTFVTVFGLVPGTLRPYSLVDYFNHYSDEAKQPDQVYYDCLSADGVICQFVPDVADRIKFEDGLVGIFGEMGFSIVPREERIQVLAASNPARAGGAGLFDRAQDQAGQKTSSAPSSPKQPGAQ